MASAGRRRGTAARERGDPGVCSDCGTRLVWAISGACCPRLSACGRGGIEERGALIRRKSTRLPFAADAAVGRSRVDV